MVCPNVIYADLFLNEDCQKILKNKYVLFLGDSGNFILQQKFKLSINIIFFFYLNIVTRSIYKDLIKLLQSNEYLNDKDLKYKGEETFENDKLLERSSDLHNNTSYTEVCF